jgi:hypothetical protein
VGLTSSSFQQIDEKMLLPNDTLKIKKCHIYRNMAKMYRRIG